MNIPNWYSLLLLAGAAWRTWRLLAEDDLLDKPRRYVTRLGAGWTKEGDPLSKNYRIRLAAFISCSWCSGFWVAAAWWGMWQWLPHGTLVGAALASVSALVGFAERVSS